MNRRPNWLRIVLVLVLASSPLWLSGCVVKQVLDSMVNEPPRAVIVASPLEGRAPLNVSFDARHSHDDGQIVEYRWNFGDSSNPVPAHASQATHTFAQPGTYLVRLTVVDDRGLADTQQVAIVVERAIPVARASVSHTLPKPGDEVTFSAEGSYDLQGQIVSYDWYFGDGGTASGKTVKHTYTQGDKTYLVTLIIMNDAGIREHVQLKVKVAPGQTRCVGGANDSCGGTQTPHVVITSPHFSCGTQGRVGDEIRMDGLATRPVVGKIVTYEWDFGDGTTATGASVSHAYTRPWTYIVTLKVVDEGGNVGTGVATFSIGGSSCN